MRPSAERPRKIEDQELLNGNNFHKWQEALKDEALDKGCWGFITGSRRVSLQNYYDHGEMSLEKFDAAISKGKENALGVIRKMVNPTFHQMIAKEEDPEKAYNILKEYFRAKTIKSDSNLTEQFVQLRMNMKEGAEVYVQEFNRLDQLLREAEMDLPVRMRKSTFCNGIPDDMETVRTLIKKSNESVEDMQKELIDSYEDFMRSHQSQQNEKSFLSTTEELIHKALTVIMQEKSFGRKRQRPQAPPFENKATCKGCHRTGHIWESCWGNPKSKYFRAGWLERSNKKLKRGEDANSAREAIQIDENDVGTQEQGVPVGLQALLNAISKQK